MSSGRLFLTSVRMRIPSLSWRPLHQPPKTLTTLPQSNLHVPKPKTTSVKQMKSMSFSLEETLQNNSETISRREYDLKSFESMFKNSKLVGVLDPVGKNVEGEIIAVTGDNLYVDFGCKFHAVVKKPKENSEGYTEGAKVVLLLKDLEMTMHPLGSSRDISLLEAEAELCGLYE